MLEKIKDRYAFAKDNFNAVRYNFNYVLLPSIIGVDSFLFILTIALLIGLRQKALAVCISLFAIIIVSIIVLVVLNSRVIKKETKIEAERLASMFNEKLSLAPETNYVLGSYKGTIELEFKDDGVKLAEQFIKYSDFECAMLTSNYCYRANLIIDFKVVNVLEAKKEGDNKQAQLKQGSSEQELPNEFTLPLDYNMLCILNKYNISLINKDVLNFVAQNTELAAKQILKYGKVQNSYFKTK